jgi:hypothetical protein
VSIRRNRSLVLSIPLTLGLASTVGGGTNRTSLPQTAPLSSKVWIGRYAEYERFLQSAAIDRVDVMGTTHHVLFKPGGLAAGAALRRDSYKLEIAGYRLDRILELDMVPPTVEIRYEGKPAALTLWILDTRLLRQISSPELRPPDTARWNDQLHRAWVFENLAANLDKNEGSPLVDSQWNLIILDHSMAFTGTLAQPYVIGQKLNQIDRPFFDRVKALDRGTVARALGDLVDGGAIDALFVRRDTIVAAFERLAAQRGSSQVFVSGSTR